MLRPKGHKAGCKCFVCRKIDTELVAKESVIKGAVKPGVSVQDRIFEFFNKGCGEGSPEIKALGLSLETINAYFAEWKAEDIFLKSIPKSKSTATLKPTTELPLESAPTEVPLNTLIVGQEFESNGTLYRVKPNGKSALLETPLKVEKYLINIPGDTLVKPM